MDRGILAAIQTINSEDALERAAYYGHTELIAFKLSLEPAMKPATSALMFSLKHVPNCSYHTVMDLLMLYAYLTKLSRFNLHVLNG
jgi:hypothetical protein